MHIKTIVAGAAIALAATIGSASAAEQFKVLLGIDAILLSSPEMEAVRGMNVKITNPALTVNEVATLPAGAPLTDIHVVVDPSAPPASVTF